MPERQKPSQHNQNHSGDSAAECSSGSGEDKTGKRAGVDLETIWSHYLWLTLRPNVSEDDKSKWLDIFLCRAIAELATASADSEEPAVFEDPFLTRFCRNVDSTSTTVASRLVTVLAIELRHLCLCFETYKDVRPLKRYVFEGRGWKILYLLSRIEISNRAEKNWISNLNPTGPAHSASDLTIKDLVELLLNLFQVRLFRVFKNWYFSPISNLSTVRDNLLRANIN